MGVETRAEVNHGCIFSTFQSWQSSFTIRHPSFHIFERFSWQFPFPPKFRLPAEQKKDSTFGWRHNSPVNLASCHVLIPRLRVRYPRPTVSGHESETLCGIKTDSLQGLGAGCPTLIEMADLRGGREGKRKEKPQTQVPWCSLPSTV